MSHVAPNSAVSPQDDEEVWFDAALARLSAGDSSAAAELVRRFGPMVRVVIRTRLRDPRLQRHFDASDVLQSVFGSFFRRTADGEFVFDDESQLAALLASIAERKVAGKVRNLYRQRRDIRRDVDAGDSQVRRAATAVTPDRIAESQEILDLVSRRMDDETRAVLEARQDGLTWAEIGAAFEQSPHALRKRFERAIAKLVETAKVELHGRTERITGA
jgi:RNA polymerase sigma factor (sigma-70 family)